MNTYNYTYSLNQSVPPPHFWSEETKQRIAKKKTAAGVAKQLNTAKVFFERFPDSDSVLNAIWHARLAKTNHKCPKCKQDTALYYRVVGKLTWRCRFCHHRISPLKGTPLERTHIPLVTIFEIMYYMLNTKHGLTAAEVSRMYGYKPYTTLKILHRIREWWILCNDTYYFFPYEALEMDEMHQKTVHPGVKERKGKRTRGKGSKRLTHVLTITGRESGVAKAVKILEINSDSVKDAIKKFGITPNNQIKTDESNIYDYLKEAGFDHATCNHSNMQWVGPNNAHTNTNEGFHRMIKGSNDNVHLGVSRKHLERYLAETCLKFSTRHKLVLHIIDDLLNSLPKLF